MTGIFPASFKNYLTLKPIKNGDNFSFIGYKTKQTFSVMTNHPHSQNKHY